MGMMWNKLYASILQKTDELSDRGLNRLFFRGQSNGKWPLLPALGRYKVKHRQIVENRLYFDFTVRGGTLLAADHSGWDYLFAMQHHGIPTRLLDWTETFAVALYFALKASVTDGAVWILHPGNLNARTVRKDAILDATDLDGSYGEVFVGRTKQMPGNVVALSPHRQNPRLAQQRAGFTLHDDLDTPLERLHPEVVTKIEIPRLCHADGHRFLRLAGVSEYSLFPDLDGLARELTDQHVTTAPR